MKVSIYIFLIPLYFFMCFSAFGQSRKTHKNYKGTYENPFSWDPAWFVPSDKVRNTYTINGNITRNGTIYVEGSYGKLIVSDTLIIYGDLYIREDNQLIINDNAVLIVFGNLRLHEDAEVTANGYLIVTEKIIRSGDHDDGRFTSKDPVKVFIGGSVPSNITNGNPRYPALNCTNPKTPYTNSTCSYGNILDLLEDPIYSFYKTLCRATFLATITPNGSISFCDGGNVILTASEGIAYRWSNGEESRSIEVFSSDRFTVRTINSIGCESTNSDPEDVIVHLPPSKPAITHSGPLNFCAGESITLTANEASSYSWSNGAKSRSIIINNQGAFKVSVTNEFGCSSQESDAVNTTVIPVPTKPTISLSGSTGFCEGENIKLSSSPGASWLWSNGAVTKDIIVSTNGEFTVKVGNAQGCISNASEPVETHVNPLPAKPSIVADGLTSFCDGGKVKLTSTSATSYSWSNGATSKSINVNNQGSFTVKITNEFGCLSKESDAVSTTVLPVPPIPIISLSGSTSFCEGDSIKLSSSQGSSWLWSNGSVAKDITVSEDDIYTVKVGNIHGCISPASEPVETHVNPLPSKPIISLSGSTSFCEGESLKLSSSAGTTWLWSNGAVTNDITVSTNGVYTVKVADILGCISPASEPVEAHVFPLPSKPSIEADGSTIFCDGDKVKLTSTSATSYEWSNGLKTRSIDVTQDGLYSVKVEDKNGCTSILSDPLKIVVKPNPVAVITSSGPLSFCEGEKRTLVAVGGNSYQWSNGMTSKSIEVTKEGKYNVLVSNQWGCTDLAVTEIIVWQNPSSYAGPDQSLDFIFETILNAELSPDEIGEWRVISGRSHVANIHSPSSNVDGLSIGENKFLWRVSNENCYDESAVIVYVEDMFLPNVITPNNDGKNDYFEIDDISVKTELLIFDRFGKLRFSDKNYSNNWNGISNEGIALPEGTYFYVLIYSNGLTKKGYVLIKR